MSEGQRSVMLVDDNQQAVATYAEILREEGYEVLTAARGEEAFAQIRRNPVSVVISDLAMPGEMSGLDLLERLRRESPEIDFVMLTGKGTVESAVKTLKMGAFDFLAKPVAPEELLTSLQRLFAYRDLENENRRLREDLLRRDGKSRLVLGSSEAMRNLLATIQAVAPMKSTVLIRGESGTGKELVADEVHARSARAEKPLIKVNCAAVPENLLESELFGHEKGAFTGAAGRRIGYFEAADGGTIFLDEIGEMSPLLQAKLLRVLQEQSFRRVGSTEEVTVDVRVICATNKDLEAGVADGSFREDLFYRINVVQITVPPLRERREDIPALAEALVHQAALRLGIPAKGFAREALQTLQQMELSGNVRELENVVEKALIFSRGPQITAGEVTAEGCVAPLPDEAESDPAPPAEAAPRAAPPTSSEEPAGDPFRHVAEGSYSLEDVERETIRRVLLATGGNMHRSAKQLKISRSTLYSKVKKFGLDGVGRDVEAQASAN
jgi:DNA-binding NtrC family response regulator